MKAIWNVSKIVKNKDFMGERLLFKLYFCQTRHNAKWNVRSYLPRHLAVRFMFSFQWNQRQIFIDWCLPNVTNTDFFSFYINYLHRLLIKENPGGINRDLHKINMTAKSVFFHRPGLIKNKHWLGKLRNINWTDHYPLA